MLGLLNIVISHTVVFCACTMPTSQQMQLRQYHLATLERCTDTIHVQFAINPCFPISFPSRATNWHRAMQRKGRRLRARSTITQTTLIRSSGRVYKPLAAHRAINRRGFLYGRTTQSQAQQEWLANSSFYSQLCKSLNHRQVTRSAYSVRRGVVSVPAISSG
jgi:hypothetical protein